MNTLDALNAAETAALLHADTETMLALARRGELPGAKIGTSRGFSCAAMCWTFCASE
jgi:hypothetical protein